VAETAAAANAADNGSPRDTRSSGGGIGFS
jgi:hypothetical protein